MGRKENDRSSDDVTVLLPLSSLSFLSIFGRVTRCNDVRGVCRVSSRTQHWGKNSSFARARYCTRVYLYTYMYIEIDIDIIDNTRAPVMSFVPFFFSFFSSIRAVIVPRIHTNSHSRVPLRDWNAGKHVRPLTYRCGRRGSRGGE